MSEIPNLLIHKDLGLSIDGVRVDGAQVMGIRGRPTGIAVDMSKLWNILELPPAGQVEVEYVVDNTRTTINGVAVIEFPL